MIRAENTLETSETTELHLTGSTVHTQYHCRLDLYYKITTEYPEKALEIHIHLSKVLPEIKKLIEGK